SSSTTATAAAAAPRCRLRTARNAAAHLPDSRASGDRNRKPAGEGKQHFAIRLRRIGLAQAGPIGIAEALARGLVRQRFHEWTEAAAQVPLQDVEVGRHDLEVLGVP